MKYRGMPTRRSFLSSIGAASAGVMLAPSIRAAAPGDPNRKRDEALDGAQDRINKYRRGPCSIRPVGPDGGRLPAGAAIKIAQRKHEFLFGCNIFELNRCRTERDNALYAERFAALLNFATLPFYWWAYERRRGEAADKATTECADWCRSHGITPKGHPLAWNFVDPPWMKDVPDSDVMRLQIARIVECVSRFKGSIDVWDVVNEATHYDREETKRNAPKLSGAIERTGVGDYLRQAFRAAREANSAACLLINDYRVDAQYESRVLSELATPAKGPAYDVIGLQSHMHGGLWPAGKTWEVCDRFAKYQRPLHFTETTIVSGPKTPAGWQTTPEGEERQAAGVVEFYTLLFSHPAVRAITWWDFSDQNAWQGAPAGLLRKDMSPKPAYDALVDLIKKKWWTRTETKLSADGNVPFDGFFGDYTISAESNGRQLTGGFTHTAEGKTQDVRLA